jgi:hypothetical protein
MVPDPARAGRRHGYGDSRGKIMEARGGRQSPVPLVGSLFTDCAQGIWRAHAGGMWACATFMGCGLAAIEFKRAALKTNSA